MPIVRNAGKVALTLTAFAPLTDEQREELKTNPAKKVRRAIDRVRLAPRSEQDVAERFVATEGAKSMIASGSLRVVTDELRQAEAKASEAQKAAQSAASEAAKAGSGQGAKKSGKGEGK